MCKKEIWIMKSRKGMPTVFFGLLFLSGSVLFAQEGLEAVLREAGIAQNRIESVLEAAPPGAWAELSRREVRMALPALSYAARRGALPENPEELERLVRAFAAEAAHLSSLGFTQREIARTLAEERRQVRAAERRQISRAAPENRGVAEEALRQAERNRLRREIRRTQRETARNRARTPGNAGKLPRRPAEPPGGGLENKPN